MYSEYDRLPGNLDGLDFLDLKRYLKVIRENVHDLRRLPNMVTAHLMKLGTTVTNLEKKGRHDMVRLLRDEIAKANDDLRKAWETKEKIEKYSPEWAKAEGTNPTSIRQIFGLGGLPAVVIGAAAIAAAAWVVNHGMSLVQDYTVKERMAQHVIQKRLEAGDATVIMQATPSPSFIPTFDFGFGAGGATVLTLGAVGVAAYLLWPTLMRRSR